MNLLGGRVAVVSGASRGIGAAIAQALADAGATVVRLARSLADGEDGQFYNLTCDLTDSTLLKRATDEVLAEFGPPHIVVNNAGGFLLRFFEETTPEEFEEQLTLNLVAPFNLARALLPAMRSAGRGHLVTIGSVADHIAFPENAAYAASKFGLRGLHETLVGEYRGTGIRLTLVSPGPTDTELWDPFDPDRRAGFTPRSMMLKPADVAEAVLFAVARPPHVVVSEIRVGPA
ncbi:MAG: SDR family NAD(P)-dependent oxidoreductase [Gemmatimonadota bacterium]